MDIGGLSGIIALDLLVIFIRAVNFVRCQAQEGSRGTVGLVSARRIITRCQANKVNPPRALCARTTPPSTQIMLEASSTRDCLNPMGTGETTAVAVGVREARDRQLSVTLRAYLRSMIGPLFRRLRAQSSRARVFLLLAPLRLALHLPHPGWPPLCLWSTNTTRACRTQKPIATQSQRLYSVRMDSFWLPAVSMGGYVCGTSVLISCCMCSRERPPFSR